MIPILVDIDLKVKKKTIIYRRNVEKTVEVYQNVIKDLIKNIDNSYLTCICLEKPGYMSGNLYKNGFHLHFPKIFLQKRDHTDFLIPDQIRTQKRFQ